MLPSQRLLRYVFVLGGVNVTGRAFGSQFATKLSPLPGRQDGSLEAGTPLVSHVRQLPSGAIEYSSVEFASGRLRSESNRIRLPSADQRGTPRPPSSLVSRRGCVPSALATYSSAAHAH